MKTKAAKVYRFINLPIRTLLLTTVLLMVLVTSCQSTTPAPASPAPSPELPKESSPSEPSATSPNVEMAIEDFSFKPATLTVPVGTTVIWYNNDSAAHTVTTRDNLFDSGSLSQGNTFSYTFEQSGTFEYYCRFHPYMTGKLVAK